MDARSSKTPASAGETTEIVSAHFLVGPGDTESRLVAEDLRL